MLSCRGSGWWLLNEHRVLLISSEDNCILCFYLNLRSVQGDAYSVSQRESGILHLAFPLAVSLRMHTMYTTLQTIRSLPGGVPSCRFSISLLSLEADVTLR